MSERPTGVAIVEDDPDILESLALLIDSAPGFACAGRYRDCESAIPAIAAAPPDVVLMDIGLPGMSGVEGIRRLRERNPRLDIIVLTVHENDETVFEALCAGASGYLVKEVSPERLMDAIGEVRRGGSPMSTQIARMVVASFRRRPSDPLTSRETEVLTQLTLGKSYRMIGDSLFISEETVRKHLKSIYRKLEVHSKSGAVARALRDRIV